MSLAFPPASPAHTSVSSLYASAVVVIMRAPPARLVLACHVLAQCAVIVCGTGCYNPEGPRIANGSLRCALQFFATGMEGKSVSLDLFDPDRGAIRTPDAPFDEEKAVVEFTAGLNGNAPSCLLLEKIEVTFKAP